MHQTGTQRIALVSVFLLAATILCADEKAFEIKLPVKGLDGTAAEEVKAAVEKLDGVGRAFTADGTLLVLLRRGGRLGLGQVAQILKTASKAEAPIAVEEDKLMLAGVFEVVITTDEGDVEFGEGAVGGFLEASGTVQVTKVEGAEPAKPAKGIATLLRVEFTPKEGESVSCAGFKEGIAASLITPDAAYGVSDIRWAHPVPAGK